MDELIRKAQQERIAAIHAAIGNEWGKKRFPILHALEDCLQAMAEFHIDLDGERN